MSTDWTRKRLPFLSSSQIMGDKNSINDSPINLWEEDQGKVKDNHFLFFLFCLSAHMYKREERLMGGWQKKKRKEKELSLFSCNDWSWRKAWSPFTSWPFIHEKISSFPRSGVLFLSPGQHLAHYLAWTRKKKKRNLYVSSSAKRALLGQDRRSPFNGLA